VLVVVVDSLRQLAEVALERVVRRARQFPALFEEVQVARAAAPRLVRLSGPAA
jgi:hypothetical protein